MKTVDLREVGARMKASRRAAKLTQQEVAEEMELTPQSVSAWEKGKSSPVTAQWVNLAGLYGASLDLMMVGIPTVPAKFVELWLESENSDGWVRDAYKELMRHMIRRGVDR